MLPQNCLYDTADVCNIKRYESTFMIICYVMYMLWFVMICYVMYMLWYVM